MTRADGVNPHFLQDLDLPLQSSRVDCRTKWPEIVMIANAVESDAFTIEEESFVHIKPDRANSEKRFVSVDDFAVLLDSGDSCIKIGLLQIPQLRVFDAHCHRTGVARAGSNRHRYRSRRRNRLTGLLPVREFIDLRADRYIRRRRRVVVERHLQFHSGSRLAHVRGSYVSSPMGHMYWCSFHQPDISIDAAARIPPGRVGGIVQTNRDYIIRTECDVGREVQFERSVAVRPAANEVPIEPDRCMGHGAIDIQIELTASFQWRNGEVFSIPTDSPPGKLASLAGVLLLERTFDAPIVRQIQLSPATIIKVALSV